MEPKKQLSLFFAFLLLWVNAAALMGQAPVGRVYRATSAPGSCNVGDLWFDTDATAGSNLFGCTASNTWTAQGGGSAPTYGTAGQSVTYPLDQTGSEGAPYTFTTANRVYLFQLTPRPWVRTLRQVSSMVYGTIDAGTDVAVCIYALDGSAKLSNADATISGAIGSGTAARAAFSGDVTLDANTAYLLGLASNKTTGAPSFPRTGGYGAAAFYNGTNSSSYVGYATNSAAGSPYRCDATTGTITWNGGSDSIPFFALRP